MLCIQSEIKNVKIIRKAKEKGWKCSEKSTTICKESTELGGQSIETRNSSTV